MSEMHSRAALFHLGLLDYSNYVKEKIFGSNLPFSVLEVLQYLLKDFNCIKVVNTFTVVIFARFF